MQMFDKLLFLHLRGLLGITVPHLMIVVADVHGSDEVVEVGRAIDPFDHRQRSQGSIPPGIHGDCLAQKPWILWLGCIKVQVGQSLVFTQRLVEIFSQKLCDTGIL